MEFAVSIQSLPQVGTWVNGIRAVHTQEPYPPPGVFTFLKTMGVSVIRLFVGQIAYRNPSRGVFILDEIEKVVDMILAAGLKVYLSNTGNMPAWASGGIPTYDGSCIINGQECACCSDGCACGNHAAGVCACASDCEVCRSNGCPGKPPSGIRPPTMKERPDFYAPGPIDPTAAQEWGIALATLLGGKVWAWSSINEIGGWWTCPRAYTAERDQFPVLDPRHYMMHAVTEIVAPFTTGVLSVLPDALMVGPEAMAGFDLADFLTIEQTVTPLRPGRVVVVAGDRAVSRPPGTRWPLVDAIAIHGGYPWGGKGGMMGDALDDNGNATGALGRIDHDFLRQGAQYFNGRELWISEGGPDGDIHDPKVWGQVVPFVQEMKRRGYKLVCIHNSDLIGTVRWQGWSQEEWSYAPNELYYQLQPVLGVPSTRPRRRAVTS